MFDVKRGPFEGSERLMLVLGPSRIRTFDVGPGPLEGSEHLMLVLGPSSGQNVLCLSWAP